MRHKRDFQVYQKTHRSGNVGWIVSLGLVNGKRKFKSFTSRDEAELFRAACLERDALRNPAALSEMDELGRAAIRHAQAKLDSYDSTITEAVDFFIKHAKPPKGKITIQDGMDLFHAAKREEGLSAKYLETARRCFFTPFRDTFDNCLMNDVRTAEAEKYLSFDKWSKTTKNTHNRHLRALYSFIIKRGHATLNPFNAVPFTKVAPQVCDRVKEPSDVRKLLQFALDKGYKAECASMVLVFFCGVRVEEVERISWEEIRLNGKNPIVNIERSKGGLRRSNEIPQNAVYWLECCLSKGPVAPPNYLKRMQRLRKKAGIEYPQNAARHCFASYHVAFFRNADWTAHLLSHRNASLLYQTYRELVTIESAEDYWRIVPASVIEEREATKTAEKTKREKEEKEWAEEQSNCGRAEKDENGHWWPVFEEIEYEPYYFDV